jgi:ribosome maturation protein SDO1
MISIILSVMGRKRLKGIFGVVYKRIMLKQPDTKVRMTNVATIRYKINNKNFEIACYRNKAVNWRNGLEEDLSEVLQIEEIYENASHGILAKKADLNKFFASKTKREIIEVILERGELQVSDKEREAQQGNILADIVKIIVEKCVHPLTKRRFTPDNIKLAIKDVHFPLKLDQPAKRQALDCIKLLQKRYKIARGEMKIRLSFEQDIQAELEARLLELDIDEVEKEEVKGTQLVRVYNIEPNKYREINQTCKKFDKVVIEVLVGVIVNEENKGLENEQFSALELIDELKEKEEKVEEEVKPEKPKKEEKGEKVEKSIKCTNCGETAVFATAQDQRQHFKSDWHVENVKRKSKGLAALSEEEHKIEAFNKDFK